MKWYEYRNMETKEMIWWTQRDANGICWEVRRSQGSDDFRLYRCEDHIGNYHNITDAMNAAQEDIDTAIECGLIEAETTENDKEENTMTQSTFTTKLGNTFTTNATGTYFYMTDTEGKKIRIKKREYEQAKREHELECRMDADEKIGLGDDEHEGLFDDLRTPEQEEEAMKEAEEWLAREDAKRGHKTTAEQEQAELDEQPCKVEVDTDLTKPAEMDQYGGVDCSNCNVTHCVHRDCMRRNPKAVGGLGECPRLAIKIDEDAMAAMDDAAEDPNVSLQEFCEMLSEDEKATIEPAEAELLNNARKEKKAKGEAKKITRKPRKSKDIAYEGHGVTLTAKQVDFIDHLPDTCFWEMGIDSVIWVDVLCDDIGGQFTDKPMTVGAMISTLCEKKLGFRMTQRREGRKCTSFSLTDLGKEVAKELGLE